MHVPFNDATTGYMEYMSNTGLSITDEVTGIWSAWRRDGRRGQRHDDPPDYAKRRLSVVNLRLVDDNGDEHLLSSSFEFIDQNDLDGDGLQNADDDCPSDAGTSTLDLDSCPDDDGDGYSDSGDAFPNDASEWADSDGDGVGITAMPSQMMQQKLLIQTAMV